MRHIMQEPGSRDCGVAVLAMLGNVSMDVARCYKSGYGVFGASMAVALSRHTGRTWRVEPGQRRLIDGCKNGAHLLDMGAGRSHWVAAVDSVLYDPAIAYPMALTAAPVAGNMVLRSVVECAP